MSRIDPVLAGIEIKVGEGATAYAIGDVVDPVPMPMDVDADDDAGDFLNVFETASNSSESSCKSDQPKRHKTKTKAEGVFGQLDVELMAMLGVETTIVEQLMIEIENATNVHAQDVSELPTMMPTVENASVAAPTRPLATVTKTLDQIVEECGLQLNGNMIWTSTGTGLGKVNYMFGQTVKCTCRNRGHVNCHLFLHFEPHGYSTVVTEAVHWLQRGVGRSQSDHRSDKLRVEAAMRR